MASLAERLSALTNNLESSGQSLDDILELIPLPAVLVSGLDKKFVTIDGANAMAVDWLGMSREELAALPHGIEEFASIEERAELRDLRESWVERGISHVSVGDAGGTIHEIVHPLRDYRMMVDIAAVRVNGTRALVAAIPMKRTAELLDELRDQRQELTDALAGRDDAVLKHRQAEFASRARLQGNRDSLVALAFLMLLVVGLSVMALALEVDGALDISESLALVGVGGIVSSLNRGGNEQKDQ